MILRCNFEEISATTFGARAYLGERMGADSPVAAPTATRCAVESLLSQFTGDLSITTLREQQEIQTALEAVVEFLRAGVDERVLATHAAAEEAVSAYFDFAHTLSVLGRVRTMGAEMRALIELMTGSSEIEEAHLDFAFPD